MSEAKFSFNSFVESEEGKGQMTVRGDTFEEFVQNWRSYWAFLGEQGYFGHEAVSVPSLDEPKEGGFCIEVENIKLASGGDNPRWVVQGGKFKKFGITCWPEVLEEAGLLEKLNPQKNNPASPGWVAYYTLKEDNKPDKVVRLSKES